MQTKTKSACYSSSSSSPFAMLFLAMAILTTLIPGAAMVSAQEQQQQQQQRPLLRPPPPMLGRLSSLFDIVKPSPSGDGSSSPPPPPPPPLPSLSLCCGGSCPPGRCDEFRTVHTDLAYAYPAPTAPPAGLLRPLPQPLNTKRPCCTPGCADGACRVPQETRSQRPTTTPAPPLPPSTTTRSMRSKATNTLNIIIGCCRTCKNCDQRAITLPDASFAAASVAATAAVEAAAARLAVRDRDSNDSDNDNDKFEGKEPLGPGKDALCVGCGKCYPCEAASVVEYLTFLPQPSGTPGDDDPGAFAAKDGETQNSSSSSADKTTASTTSSNTDPEPTYYIGDEINDAINGQNQDILPIIVQSGISSSNSNSSSSNSNHKPELITLLATIDFKLQENYISRRMLSELALRDKVQDFPRGAAAQIAFLSFHQDKSTINASIVLDLVTGNTAAKTKTHFKNVRFLAFGSENEKDEAATIRIPDVILGAKFFREVGGLSVFPAFKTQVEEGVQVVHPVHRGKLGGVKLKAASEGGEEGGEQQRHDEL